MSISHSVVMSISHSVVDGESNCVAVETEKGWFNFAGLHA
jgi:hypothetical protein